MDPLKMPEVEPRPPVHTAPERAVPEQRRPRPQVPTPGPWGTVLIAGPDGAANAALRTALSRIGADRIVQADSTTEVWDLLARGGTGDLALVSARFGTDTDPLIRALLGGGWSRVIVRTPTGATKPVVSAVLAGATGVLTIPGATHDPGTDPRVPTTLTAREIEVVTQVADGRSNKEIATVMSLSALTVKNHLARIGRKLGTGDRAQIVAMACRDGVIS
jgi:DNA-binding CsgD family transcriptional regulator